MNGSRTKFFYFLISAVIITISFTSVYAQQAASSKIEGSYQAVLKFPKASPTAILTFCPGSGDVPFTGNWTENGGEKLVNDMTKQKINGNELSFTIQAGPGIWDFLCTIDGKTIKGAVTGDGATSAFEGPRVTLKKDFCAK
jgi:hypothetical protein